MVIYLLICLHNYLREIGSHCVALVYIYFVNQAILKLLEAQSPILSVHLARLECKGIAKDLPDSQVNFNSNLLDKS